MKKLINRKYLNLELISQRFNIKKENIIGIVRIKLPYIGYPTVWFSEV